MYAILAAIFTLLMAMCVVIGILQPRRNVLAERLMPVGAAVGMEDPEMDRSLWDRIVGPLVQSVVAVVWRITPPSMLNKLDEQLIIAGRPGGISAPTFLAITLPLAFILPIVFFAYMASTGKLSMMQVLLAGGFAVICFQAPRSWLSVKIKARQKAAQKSLPDALDLIVVCVEAGLGLDAALAKVADETKGPLADELRKSLLESSMGKLRRIALRDMAGRLQVPDLTSFVGALCQADQMGTSLAQVLRAQSAQMRVKRRQRAEQEAMRAPLKMLFPLVFFIFPAIFVVLLGPAAINLMSAFSQR